METKTKRRPISEVIGRVAFDPANVIAAAAENSTLFADTIDYRVECMQRRADAKALFERVQAECDLRVRQEAYRADEKITEKQVASKVVLDPLVSQVQEKHNRAETLDEYAKLACELFRMRRDCLKIVGDLTRDGINAQAAIEQGNAKMADARRKLRQRFPEA